MEKEKAMISNKHIFEIAYNFLRNNHLSNVTLENLVFIIEKNGYELMEYSENELMNKNHIIQQLGIADIACMAKAFTYSNTSLKFVFIREELSGQEKLLALAHEVGHIECGHLEKKNVSPDNVGDEYEANEFAHYILHIKYTYRFKLYIYEHRKTILATAAIIGCFIILFFSLLLLKKTNLSYGNFYISQNGEKYHLQECIIIKNKKNIRRITEDEFNSGEFDFCQVCLPNK